MKGIYKIENIINHKKYIGQANDIHTRFKRHKNDLKRHIHHNEHLQRSWDKYGPEAFEFSILELTEDLNVREQHWINEYKTINSKFGYNKTSGGENYIVSDETKQKLSKSLSGKPKSDDHKKNLWKNRSRKSSNETKLKISIGLKKYNEEKRKSQPIIIKPKKERASRVVSEDTKLKISKANLGRKLTDDKRKSYWKLDDEFVLSIIDYLNKNPNQSINSIAKQFNVSRNTIYNIRDNKTYTHLKRGNLND